MNTSSPFSPLLKPWQHFFSLACVLAIFAWCQAPLGASHYVYQPKAHRRARAHTSHPQKTVRAGVPDDPDQLELGQAASPLEENLKPLPYDTLGECTKTALESADKVVVDTLKINRVVSYATNEDGSLPLEVIHPPTVLNGGVPYESPKVVSEKVKLTVIYRLDNDPVDNGKCCRMKFISLNGFEINILDDAYCLGQMGYARFTCLVPSQYIKFAKANINPFDFPASQTNALPAPTPGENLLRYSFYGADDLKERVGINTYPFLEFNAAAPILMVHGVNADHTSWEAPKKPLTITTPLGQWETFEAFVQSPKNQGGYFDQASSVYKGLWFYNINVGLEKEGNASIEASADDLYRQIPKVMNALGARACHVIAHSKGGLDARKMITKHLITSEEDGLILSSVRDRSKLKKGYKLLSFYTVGSPHRGSPSADAACLIRWYNMIVTSQSADAASAGASCRLSIRMSPFSQLRTGKSSLVPTGEALDDLRTNGAILALQAKEQEGYNANVLTSGHFYNLVGDADVDGTGDIRGLEGVEMFDPFPRLLLHKINHIWRFMGLFASVKVTRIVDKLVLYLDATPNDAEGVLLPNDLTVPLWSGRCDGGKDLQVPWVVGAPVAGSYKGLDFKTLLSPGNHSLMKSKQTAYRIIQNIHQDYPIGEPAKRPLGK